jgi:hypothetical protein
MRAKKTKRPWFRWVALALLVAAAVGLTHVDVWPGPTWVVEGVAATCDMNLNGFAFSREVLARGPSDLPGTAVVVEHAPACPIGHVERAWLVRDELRVRIVVSKAVPATWEMVKDGTLSRFSLNVRSFRVYPGYDPKLGLVETVKDGVVVGVSFTTRPADPRAVVTKFWED